LKWLFLSHCGAGIDMSLKLNTIFLAFLLSLIFFVTLTSNGYCDDWVLIGSNKNFTLYYNSSSVKIDDKNHVIKVLGKRVFTKNGKIEFFNGFNKDNVKDQEYIDLNYSVGSYLLDYRQRKYSFNDITAYSKSGNVLYTDNSILKWKDIIPNSLVEFLINKLINDCNIQK
jgi:hypothetical protein